MRNRLLSGILAVTICSLSLCGCGSGKTASTDLDNMHADETSATADEGIITLRIWAEEANFDMLTKMCDSFKANYARQAEFDIVLEVAADSANKDVLLGDVHNGADVFPFADDQLSAMVAAGAIAPVAETARISEANLKEAVDAASINGILYGYPMTADNGYFMYYDKHYFSSNDVQTLDRMLAIAEEADKQITMDWSSGWYLYAFFGNTGLDFGMNDDGVTNYCNWNSTDGAIKGTDIAQALLAISASPAFKSCIDTDFLAGVQDGSIIAGVSGAWNAMEIKNAWGVDYGAVKLPTYACAGKQVQMSSFTGYKMMGVNAYSQHKEWAMKLADWLTNEENQTLRFVERNQGPSNINAASSEEVTQVPAIQAVIAQSEFGKLQRVGNNFWTPCMNFGNTMADGNPSQTPLQELLDTLVTGITASVVQ